MDSTVESKLEEGELVDSSDDGEDGAQQRNDDKQTPKQIHTMKIIEETTKAVKQRAQPIPDEIDDTYVEPGMMNMKNLSEDEIHELFKQWDERYEAIRKQEEAMDPKQLLTSLIEKEEENERERAHAFRKEMDKLASQRRAKVPIEREMDGRNRARFDSEYWHGYANGEGDQGKETRREAAITKWKEIQRRKEERAERNSERSTWGM